MNNSGRTFLAKFNSVLDAEIPRIDFHVHTNWTDGENSVLEMYEDACGKNLECILFSEHARKTSSKWFSGFAEEVRSLPKTPCKALVGVETKIIDYDGNIDVDSEILSQCDLVIGSVHRFPDRNSDVMSFDAIPLEEALEIEVRLSESLLKNPNIDILGHPMGMCALKLGLPYTDEIIFSLIKTAGKTNVAFEINSKYHSDPLHFLELCKETGTRVSLGSDAHSVEEIGHIVTKLENSKIK